MRSEAVALAASRSRSADFAALAKPRLNMLVVASALAGYATPEDGVSSVKQGAWLRVGSDSLWLETIELPDAPGTLVAYAPSLEWVYSAAAANPLYLDLVLARARARGWRVSRIGSARGPVAPVPPV